MKSEKIEFPGTQGMLAARLDTPADRPRAYALFAHCFTCTKDILAAGKIARRLAARGIAVLRFDFTGLGASDGEFANSNFTSNVEDLVKAAAWLGEEHQAPALVVGHSLGGTAALKAARQIPACRAVVAIGAPFDPAHVSTHFGDKIRIIEQGGEAEVLLAGRPFRVKKQFLDDIRSAAIAEDVANLRRALLIAHAPRDELVAIENASRIFAAAKHPKSFLSLDDADHLLSRPTDAEYAAEVIAAWSARYLDLEPSAMPHTTLAVKPRETLVIERGDGTFTQSVRAGGHDLVADEPESLGGDGRGPGPYDFLLTALGACTAMTLRMYATHKGLALERVAVRLRHGKIHADDCEDCETKDGMLDEIEREIELVGDLDPAARQRLFEIANKCPVHKTLTSEVKIRTRLKD
ncbi:MAG: alpha/beta fold hydrolase [Pseudomonadota bacterium]